MKQGEKIIYLHLHKPIEGRQDFYYPSLSEMYKKVHPNTVGVTHQSLRNCRFNERCFYANKFCTSELITLD